MKKKSFVKRNSSCFLQEEQCLISSLSSFDSEIAMPSMQLSGVHDLSSPLDFIVTTYQDYEWTLQVERPMERYFTIAGQIGTSVIDPENCRAVVMVAEDTDLTDITVTSLKLGPREVTAFGQTQTWNLEALPTHIIVSCAASQYGDYFTGCSSSKLWIDKVELVY